MVEEHVGKKRRKEVRQAINMSEELRKTLLLIISVLTIGCLIVLILFFISFYGVVELPAFASSTVPLAILIIAMVFIAPKANRYWALRDEYKEHLKRYNISKADMKALKNNEL